MIQFVVFYGVLALYGMNSGRFYKGRRRFLLFSFLIFAVMAAMRHSSIGNDTLAYEKFFEQIATTNYLPDIGRFELGFVVFSKIISYLSTSPQFFIIVTSVIVFLAFYLEILHYSDNYVIAVLLFLSCGLYRFSLSAIRQSLAISILLLATYYLIRKKNIVFFGLCVLAFFFHKSSIVASILIFASTFRWHRLVYRSIPFVSLGISIFAKSFVMGVISNYADYGRYLTGIYAGEIRTATLLIIAMEVVVIVVISLVDSNDKNDEVFIKLSYFRLGLLVASINLNAIDRIADYFTIFEIVALCNSLEKYKGKDQFVLKFIILTMYFSYTLVWGVFRPEIQMVWPYHTFFYMG